MLRVLDVDPWTDIADVFANSNPIGTQLLKVLPNDRKLAAIEILDGTIRERSDGGPALVHSRIHVAVGAA